MAIYHGIVKGNAVMLPEGVELEEGTEVEVRPLTTNGVEVETPEQRFRRQLREAGIVLNFPDPSQRRAKDDFEPINVEGQPLSQMIIEERR